MVENDEDLSVLGQEDADTLDMPEEGEVELTGKAKAAFVKSRQERKALKDELEQTKSALEQLRAAHAAAQTAPQSSDSPNLVAQKRRYRESVHLRAVQSLEGEVFASEQQRDAALWQEMAAIMAMDAMEVGVQNFAAMQAPQVTSSVLSEFSMLNEDDRAAVRQLVDKLPPNLKVNPDAIRKEVHSYIGANVQRFTGAPETPESEKETGGKATGGSPATAKTVTGGRLHLGKEAAAAAASGLKGGSPGVKLTEPPGGKPRGQAQSLSDEDIVVLRQQGGNPTDPTDVKLFLEAKKGAKQRALGG